MRLDASEKERAVSETALTYQIADMDLEDEILMGEGKAF